MFHLARIDEIELVVHECVRPGERRIDGKVLVDLELRGRVVDTVSTAEDGLVIDPEKFIVQYHGKDISLAKKEFELLYLLASKPGRVFVRNEILNQVWGAEVIVGDRTIDVHIRKIRQKLGVDCITTVKGVGYKFEL